MYILIQLFQAKGESKPNTISVRFDLAIGIRFDLAIEMKYFGIGQFRRFVSNLPLILYSYTSR